MVAVVLIAAGIFAVASVVLIGIATAIVGIISRKVSDQDAKTRLLVSAGVTGITGVVAIIAAIVGLLYGGRKTAGKKSTGLLITFIVAVVLVVGGLGTTIGLNLSLRNNDNLNPDQKRSMLVAIILAGVGVACMAVAAFVLFVFAKSKIPKGFSNVTEFRGAFTTE